MLLQLMLQLMPHSVTAERQVPLEVLASMTMVAHYQVPPRGDPRSVLPMSRLQAGPRKVGAAPLAPPTPTAVTTPFVVHSPMVMAARSASAPLRVAPKFLKDKPAKQVVCVQPVSSETTSRPQRVFQEHPVPQMGPPAKPLVSATKTHSVARTHFSFRTAAARLLNVPPTLTAQPLAMAAVLTSKTESTPFVLMPVKPTPIVARPMAIAALIEGAPLANTANIPPQAMPAPLIPIAVSQVKGGVVVLAPLTPTVIARLLLVTLPTTKPAPSSASVLTWPVKPTTSAPMNA